jgi:signal transduction histidine kinase
MTNSLAISKMEARKQKFNPSPLNLEEFCREMVDDLQMTLDSQHTLAFTCAVQDSTSLASAYLDKKLLRYIIGNSALECHQVFSGREYDSVQS